MKNYNHRNFSIYHLFTQSLQLCKWPLKTWQSGLVSLQHSQPLLLASPPQIFSGLRYYKYKTWQCLPILLCYDGNTIIFTCVYCSEIYLFGFLQDDKEILSNDYTEIFHSSARCSLTLLNTQIEDCGTYSCIAINSAGQASCLAKLSVDTGELESFIFTIRFIFTNPECLLPRNSVFKYFLFFFQGPDDIVEDREVEFGKRRKLHSVYDVHEEIGR